MKREVAEQIIRETTEAYNRIAGHFSETRAAPWPEFRLLEPYLRAGQHVLDVGCGNGRLIPFLEPYKPRYIGVDVSRQLLAEASKRVNGTISDAMFQVASHTDLPFPDATFDVVFSIASLYHVPSRAYRTRAMEESLRVLKEGGVFCFLTWNIWQPQFWPLQSRAAARKLLGQSALDFKDVLKPWKNARGEIVIERYCHAFTATEINALVTKAGGTVQRAEYVFRDRVAPWWKARNILLIAKR